MKQFCYDISGSPSSTFDLEHALHRAAYASERLIMRGRFEALAVGETLTDVDGDVWTRLPDVVLDDEPQTETCLASDVADERLERIAAAAMAAIISKHQPLHGAEPEYAHVPRLVARGAVEYARALIAELDKPA